MNIIFFGSSSFSVPSLKSIASHTPWVVTKKAKPKGRGYSLDDNEVKKAAIELDLPVLEMGSFKDEAAQRLKELKPDLFVVVSFGLMLPNWSLELPTVGAINVHPSLLPKHRGPSPIQWAILNGEDKTGITIMKIVEKMDAGNIIYQEGATINKEDNAITLSARLSEKASEMLPEVINKIRSHGMMEGIEQKDEEATYTPIITKEMGKIDWHKTGTEIARQVKAFILWPTAYTFLNDVLFKIFDGNTDIVHRDNLPGTILEKNRDGILVATADGSILVREVQLENRKRVRASEFANGYRGLIGTVLK
jgi:methionyl-tRNA formyltransferase